MTQQRLERLIHRLEGYSQDHRHRYKAKVALIALAGYAYVLLVFGLAISLAVWLVFSLLQGGSGQVARLKVVAGLVILSAIILRSFWVRFDPPTGIAITREHAPRLFALLDKFSSALAAPRIYHVLVVNDLNAGITQVPKLGIFGWHHNYLLIGYPLMLSTTPAQFRAVLAHELGHLGHQHSRFAGWIYRVRTMWSKLLTDLESRKHWGSFLFSKFVGWYAPFFNAYSFVLARAQEYEADRQAAKLVGPHCVKDALASLEVISRILSESFWPTLNRKAVDNSVPPASHLQEMARTFKTPLPRELVEQWFTEALQNRTGYANTHPSLSDRFYALDQLPDKKQVTGHSAKIPQLLGPQDVSALTHYLGLHAEEVRAQLDRQWLELVGEQWRLRHFEMTVARKRCQQLSDKSAGEILSQDELWEYACQLEVLERENAAVPILQRLLAAHPTHASGNFALGRLLLARGEQEGIKYLEAAMAVDRNALIPGYRLVAKFLERRGRPEESLRYERLAREQQITANDADNERKRVSPQDLFLPHNLPGEITASIERQLAALPGVKAAFFVQKQVREMPEVPCYVLFVFPRYRWYEWRHDDKDEALLGLLAQEVKLPTGTYVYVVGQGECRRWRKALHTLPEAQLGCSV